MRYWRLDRPRLGGQLDLGRAAGLVAAIGRNDVHAFAEEILKTVSNGVPISQCTIFAYEFCNRPRTIAVADRRGGRFLSDIAENYARHYYSLDGNQQIVCATNAEKLDPAILLHQQSGEELDHEGYRTACYKRPNVSDRVSLLMQPAKNIWLSVNFYRDRDQRNFLPGEIERIEALAPLFAHAAKHHYTLCGQQSLSQLMLARVRNVCPQLSKRELDVLRGILEGRTAVDIADVMGIQPSSVVTYQKRAYKRLGISSQRQLFALCLSPA